MLLSFLIASALSAGAQAQSLGQLYQQARSYDATYLAAQAQLAADQARAAQAQAGVRPQLGASASANQARLDDSLTGQRSVNTQNAALSASLPLYRPANRLAVQQAERALDAAQAQWQLAEQALAVRSAQAYFDVLGAQDTLRFVRAQLTAVTEQLAAANSSFNLGTTTITDVREAQARHDLVRAQEIAAENDLHVKQLALEQLVGQNNLRAQPLRTAQALPALAPQQVQHWVDQAQAQHPGLRQARAALDMAGLEVQRAQAAKGPVLDLVGQYALARAPNALLPQAGNARTHTASVGLQLNLPLYAGGALDNRVLEASRLEDKARADLDAALRSITQATRAAFYGVLSGQQQVQALEAAQASSQSALEANQLGYREGVRINIDVLNAQSQLYQTKRDLALARYQVLLGGLKLRQANGSLRAEDVHAIDALLAPASAAGQTADR